MSSTLVTDQVSLLLTFNTLVTKNQWPSTKIAHIFLFPWQTYSLVHPKMRKFAPKSVSLLAVIPTQNALDWLRFHIEGCNFFIDCRHVANYDWSMESMSLRDFICHRQSFFSNWNKFQLIYAFDQSILILIMVKMGLTGLSYHIIIVSLQFGFDSCNSLIGFIQDLGPSEVFATRLPQSPTWHTVL